MKVLLDENLPQDLRHDLVGHEAFTVAYMGWKGLENGDLLTEAARHGFDAVMTKDAGIEYEHNPAALPVAVVIVHARSNAIEVIRPLVPQLLRVLSLLKPKTLIHIGP